MEKMVEIFWESIKNWKINDVIKSLLRWDSDYQEAKLFYQNTAIRSVKTIKLSQVAHTTLRLMAWFEERKITDAGEIRLLSDYDGGLDDGSKEISYFVTLEDLENGFEELSKIIDIENDRSSKNKEYWRVKKAMPEKDVISGVKLSILIEEIINKRGGRETLDRKTLKKWCKNDEITLFQCPDTKRFWIYIDSFNTLNKLHPPVSANGVYLAKKLPKI